MENTVYFAPCAEYSEEAIRTAFDRLLPAGALDFVTEGMKVAIKVNLVSAMKPESAGVTHPALVRELCRRLVARGADVVVGDSPGGPFNAAMMATVYRVSGMQAVEEVGARLNRDFSQTEVEFPEAREARRFTVATWLTEVDAVINFAKLKTHGMMGYSGAVKNLFGTIPGTLKLEYHFSHPDPARFANMLVDLNEYWRCRLHLLDGVVGMEGNGPTAGEPRAVGVLLASPSSYALDTVAVRLMGLDPATVPTVVAAIDRGLCTDGTDVTVDAEVYEYIVPDYKLIERGSVIEFSTMLPGALGRFAGKLAPRLLASRPAPKKRECIGCRKCESVCPAKAIVMKNKLPRIDRTACIRCFCCQEFCPVGAMKVKRPAMARLLNHKKAKKKEP